MVVDAAGADNGKFDAAGTIQEKYAPILGSDELAFKLAIRFQMFHCEENRTPETLEAEFKSMLVDLGWERKLGPLADMLGRAEGREKQFVKDALLEGMQKCGANGYALEPAGLWEKSGLGPELIDASEDAVIAAAQARARDGGNLLGDAAALLGMPSTPWRVADEICRACAGTKFFTRIADLFAREDKMPTDSLIIVMGALSSSIDGIVKSVRKEIEGIERAGLGDKAARKMDARKPLGQVACLLQKKKLPGSVYVRVIKACKGCGLHGMGFVEMLGELFPRADVSDNAKAEAGKALLEGEMEACTAAGHPHYVSGIRNAIGVPDAVRKKAGEILGAHARQGEGRTCGGNETGRRQTPVTPNGFVASGFRSPSGRIVGKVTPVEMAQTILAKPAKEK
jgi:hypothetical protein